MSEVKIKKTNPKALIPEYMSLGAAGCDICACIESPMTLAPLQRAAVPTGLSFQIPDGFEIQVRPRSGLSFKKGLTVVNSPGTIDSDYRGEVKVLLINLSAEPVEILPCDRIAQIVMHKVERINWSLVSELDNSIRGEGGFGSTGINLNAINPA